MSGGRPGETVSWSNTGSGTILSAGKSTTFDAQGNAYATVQGTAPFTDTINTVNPDCNVKAETKYQSVNITLPFNLVISPQDRWCEIHLSRVDYITTVSGGFPNTAVRVDFTSSSGHDPNYSNRIMYFDANGNLTFSNFCTQQSHSGSVDTWNITYMGKHYHFTIHWYW